MYTMTSAKPYIVDRHENAEARQKLLLVLFQKISTKRFFANVKEGIVSSSKFLS